MIALLALAWLGCSLPTVLAAVPPLADLDGQLIFEEHFANPALDGSRGLWTFAKTSCLLGSASIADCGISLSNCGGTFQVRRLHAAGNALHADVNTLGSMRMRPLCAAPRDYCSGTKS